MSKIPQKTRLAHGGRRKEWTHGVVNPPIYRASTCLFDSYEEMRQAVAAPWDRRHLFYARKGTPTHWSLEEALTQLHVPDPRGDERTHLYPSGLAAVSMALLAAAKSGDHLLMTDNAYEPTRLLAEGFLRRMGIRTTYFDPRIGADIAALLQDKTAAILLESPGSLTLEMQDIPAIAAAARQHPARPLVVVDNTWASPLFCQPLALGADLAVEAITKHIGGHADLMMGSVTANRRAATALRQTTGQLGQTVSPQDAALALRGLRTLGVRLDAQGRAALTIARWLEQHPLVERVLFPALDSDPGHALWKRDMSGAAGLFSFVLKAGDYPHTAAMVDQMRLFSMGFSWGGYESLIMPSDPAPCRTAVPWQATGPLIRLGIGLEDTDDLIADLSDGLDRYARAIA